MTKPFSTEWIAARRSRFVQRGDGSFGPDSEMNAALDLIEQQRAALEALLQIDTGHDGSRPECSYCVAVKNAEALLDHSTTQQENPWALSIH